MLLLITGASGVGKSAVRTAIASALSPVVECVELLDLTPLPEAMTRVWRQRAAEAAVRRAVELRACGRHLLLAGDPVPAAEVVAVPSAPELDAVAACLLDVTAEEQAERLAARGDDPALLPHHQAFAEWMRLQARDPLHMTHVVSDGGWEEMRWERLERLAPEWRMHTIDTTHMTKREVADAALDWARRALAGNAPALRLTASEPGHATTVLANDLGEQSWRRDTRAMSGASVGDEVDPLLGVLTSLACRCPCARRDSSLFRGRFGPAGLLLSLGMLFGEDGAFVKRVGNSAQSRCQTTCSFDRMSRCTLSTALTLAESTLARRPLSGSFGPFASSLFVGPAAERPIPSRCASVALIGESLTLICGFLALVRNPVPLVRYPVALVCHLFAPVRDLFSAVRDPTLHGRFSALGGGPMCA